MPDQETIDLSAESAPILIETVRNVRLLMSEREKHRRGDLTGGGQKALGVVQEDMPTYDDADPDSISVKLATLDSDGVAQPYGDPFDAKALHRPLTAGAGTHQYTPVLRDFAPYLKTGDVVEVTALSTDDRWYLTTDFQIRTPRLAVLRADVTSAKYVDFKFASHTGSTVSAESGAAWKQAKIGIIYGTSDPTAAEPKLTQSDPVWVAYDPAGSSNTSGWMIVGWMELYTAVCT